MPIFLILIFIADYNYSQYGYLYNIHFVIDCLN